MWGPSPAPAEAVVSRDVPFTLLGCGYLPIALVKCAIARLSKRSWKKKNRIFNTNANRGTSCVRLAAFFWGSSAEPSGLNLPSPPPLRRGLLSRHQPRAGFAGDPPGCHPVPMRALGEMERREADLFPSLRGRACPRPFSHPGRAPRSALAGSRGRQPRHSHRQCLSVGFFFCFVF